MFAEEMNKNCCLKIKLLTCFDLLHGLQGDVEGCEREDFVADSDFFDLLKTQLTNH